MCAKQRLPAEERKKQIRGFAKKVFLQKGFSNTTMEDVIAEVGMSKGGVYRHYSSTADMLYDLMVDGNHNRFEISDSFMRSNPDMLLEDVAVELFVMKILDSAEYKSLYAMFLMEAEKNVKLKELKKEMEKRSKREYLEFIDKRGLDSLKCLINDEMIAFINSIILATEVLDVRAVFLDHKDLFRNIIHQYIENSNKNLL